MPTSLDDRRYHQQGQDSISSIGTIRQPTVPPPASSSSSLAGVPTPLLKLPALDSGYPNHHHHAAPDGHKSGGSSPAWSSPPLPASGTTSPGLNLTLAPQPPIPNLSPRNSSDRNTGFRVMSRPTPSSSSSSSSNPSPLTTTIRPVVSPPISGMTRDTSHYPFYDRSTPFGVDLSEAEQMSQSMSLPATTSLGGTAGGGEIITSSTRSSPGLPTLPLPAPTHPDPPRRSSTQSLLTQQILASPSHSRSPTRQPAAGPSSTGLVRRESVKDHSQGGVVGGMIKRNSFLGKAFGSNPPSHSSSLSSKGKEKEHELDPHDQTLTGAEGGKSLRNPSSSSASSSVSTGFIRGRRQSQQLEPTPANQKWSPVLGSASSTSSAGGWGSLGALQRGKSRGVGDGKGVARASTELVGVRDVMGDGRGRNVSEGSRMGGSEGEEGDVIETAELLFNRDPSSGRKMINQYLIMQEIGRGQHGTVRLGKDMSTPTPEHSRAATAPSSVPSTPGRSNPPSALGLNDMAQDHFAAAQSQFAPIQNQVLSDPDLPAALSLSMAAHGGLPGHGQGGGGFWAIKIVDRQPRRRLPGAGKKGFGGLGGVGGQAQGPTTGEKIKREIAILKKCRHPNVVRLREVIDAPISKKIYLILEYCEGGELKWKTDEGKPYLTVAETRELFRDVVCGLQYLHHQGIIHRDIKPANLLFAGDGVVKISDFGVSHYSHVLRGTNLDGESPDEEDPAFMDDHDLAKTAGSPAFFAPELCYNGEATPIGSVTPHREAPEFRFSSFSAGSGGEGNRNSGHSAGSGTIRPDSAASVEFKRNRPPITQAIDVWALGVTLYCLLFARTPFEAPSEYALFSIIPVDDYDIPPTMGADGMKTGGRQGHRMVKGTGPPEEAKEVLDLLERLLEKDPTKRISLTDVKKHPFTLRGLSDQGAWLASTDPGMDTFVTVSNDEVAAAVTDTRSFKDRFKKGMKHITQMSHKLHLFASGASKSRSRSGSVVTGSDDRSSGFPSESGSTATSLTSAASQLASPNMKPASRNTSGSKGTPRVPSGQSDTSGRAPSPKPALLTRRFSVLGSGTPKKPDHPIPAPIHTQPIQLASPSAATLALPDLGDRLGRSMSDRSTGSSSSHLQGPALLQRRQSTHLAPPMSAGPSTSSSSGSAIDQRQNVKGLATSTSLERMDNIILRSITPSGTSAALPPSRRSMTTNLRRRQSSDVDAGGRQRALSNASSSGGLHKLARYISRGLSQKSSSSRVSSQHRSTGHLGPTGEGEVSPPSDQDDTIRVGIDFPSPAGLIIKSESAEDVQRRSMDTLSSSMYSAALSSPSVNQQRLPPIHQHDWDSNRGFGISPEKDRVSEQEEVDWDGGELTEDDDDDYGQDLRPYKGIPRGDDDLLQGSWKLDSSGWQGGHGLLPSALPKQGLGLIDTTPEPGRFNSADEGSSPDTIMPTTRDTATPVGHATVPQTNPTGLALPASPSPASSTLPPDDRRRSFSRNTGIPRSPYRGIQERARSPLGLLSLEMPPTSPLRFSDRAGVIEDEDDDDEGLAIAIGNRRGRRTSKPATPLVSGPSHLPNNGFY